VGLTSPCAQVIYDILGTGGSPLLPDNTGYAVSVDGTWLVATNTVCTLLGLFYQAEGETGTPPGCPGTSPGPPTTVIAPTSATTSPASSPDSPGTTTPSRGTAATNPPTTQGPTGAGTSGSSDPSAPSDPVVAASSGALAFTGLGGLAQLLAVVGGALMVLGFALLAVVDAPRRVMHRLAYLAPARRRPAPHAGPGAGGGTGGATTGAADSERLWIRRP